MTDPLEAAREIVAADDAHDEAGRERRDRAYKVAGAWQRYVEAATINGSLVARALLARALLDREPVPMVLHCPACGAQHVDAPDSETGWTNPPHRSHLCHACGHVWRPADIATTGVVAVATRGQDDSPPLAREHIRALPAKEPT